MKQDEVIQKVVMEVMKAAKKYPTWPTDPIHALAVLGEEYGELNKAVVQMAYEPHKASFEQVEEEAVQTAAMAIRFLMSLNDYSYGECNQHEQDHSI